jgi:hypothetical protein
MMKEKEEDIDLSSQPSKGEPDPEPAENPNQGLMYYIVRSSFLNTCIQVIKICPN